jgi:hypothetical protein
VTGSITADDIFDTSKKQTIDYYVAVVVVVSWLRFFSYFLVVRSISKLLNTLIKMFIDTVSFVFLMSCYLILAASIMTTLFQGIEADMYGTMVKSLRTLFDTTLGNYGKVTLSRNDNLHTYLIMIHLIISNVFLLNYLVAILSSAYEFMRDFGEFDYKANRYSYIEKYTKAHLNKQGFAELVVHPAPINIFSLLLLPFAFVPNTFSGKAEVFSKLMFWIENLFFVILLLIYSIILIPIIFFKMLYNFFRSMKIYTFVPIALTWIVLGLLVLPFYAFKDVAYLIIILCNYNDEEDQMKEKKQEDDKQDRIMVYNEVIDVMRAIYVVVKKKKELFDPEYNNFSPEMNENLEENDGVKFLIDKDLIIQAWKRYRPQDVDKGEDNDEEVTTTAHAATNKNFVTVVGNNFFKRVTDNLKHNFNTAEQDEDRAEESDGVSSQYTQIGDNIPEDELKIVDIFLKRFLLSSDTSETEVINLKLSLRALPRKINDYNEPKIELLDFSTVQLSLIAFQNDDKDELFEFYDRRNMKRLFRLRNYVSNNTEIKQLDDLSQRLMLKARKIFNVGSGPGLGGLFLPDVNPLRNLERFESQSDNSHS